MVKYMTWSFFLIMLLGLIRDVSGTKSMLLCGECVGPKESDSYPTQMSEAAYR